MLLYNWLKTAVKAKGSAKALVYRDTYLSWRGLSHRVDRRSAEFKSAGIRPGDFVGLMLGNVPDLIILSLALSKIRAAPLPLDPTTSSRELDMLMSVIPMRGLVTRPRGSDGSTNPLGDNGQTVAVVKPSRKFVPESRRRLQGTLLSCSIYDVPARVVPKAEKELIGAVLITSNSAGDPKPVERTLENLNAEAVQLAEALTITSDDRVLLTVPLFHSFGFDVGMVAGLSVGATLHLEDEIAPSRIAKLVREHKITLLPGTPTLFTEISRLPASRPFEHESIRFLATGSAPSPAAFEVLHKKLGVRPFSSLHSSETGTIAIELTGTAPETVGKPLPQVELKLVAAKTSKAPSTGKPGIMWIRSKALSPLQLVTGQQAMSKTTSVGHRDDDGWYRTGDIASIDRSGNITLHGREDDLVRIDGKRIALGEVAGCIESFPKVSAAQATVVTDPLGGPMVVAKVVLKKQAADLNPEEIIDYCARNLSPHKVPRRIEICERL